MVLGKYTKAEIAYAPDALAENYHVWSLDNDIDVRSGSIKSKAKLISLK
ncbi:hypothetical protein [Flagellimonas flava]|uniref:Uncharacterized protein n=1 Tax=Flagellimonas flava TaxID=570519 RepID=A0A1M5ICM0_9FLAO|nr:hypothetical protein [Allomuricauda flava]SHG26056.1 hypothetical protein SAMN04488116_0619 [Allomuricauda flava]